MTHPLELYFEDSVAFRLADRTPVEGSVYIGDVEFDPVNLLRTDDAAFRSEFQAWQNDVWEPEQRDRREDILSLHANRSRYDDLCATLDRGQLVPFVGSGMSCPSGLPTWSNLLRAVREHSGVRKSDLERLLSSFKFEAAAQLLSESMSRGLFDERIEHTLRYKSDHPVLGAIRLPERVNAFETAGC
jgi:hypothetical protein